MITRRREKANSEGRPLCRRPSLITRQRVSSAIAPSPWTRRQAAPRLLPALQCSSFKNNAPIYSLDCWRTREGGGSRV